MTPYPKKEKSIPTYESQHFLGLVVADPITGKKRIRINDEIRYSYFVNQKCQRGDIVSFYITNKRPKRTVAQVHYFFEYLSLISLSTGNSTQALKAWVTNTFLLKGITEVFGETVRIVRSITELNISEMAELIERISETTGIPPPPTELFKLPHSPEQHEKLKQEERSIYQNYKCKVKIKA